MSEAEHSTKYQNNAYELRAQKAEYVLRCGSLYLGYKKASRVVSVDRAVQFVSREAAERCAIQMRGDGVFQMPWEVVSVQEGHAA